MAKDPAFLFYPGDWQLGTMHMTTLEKGAYMDLLMLQFARGKFTLAHAKHMLNGSFDLVWATVKEKFKTDGEWFWNERLEVEKEKRQKFTKSRRDNALQEKKDKTDPKKEETHAEHMRKHMENENDNKNEDIKPNKKGVENDDDIPCCEFMPWPLFDDFWDLYDKKVDLKSCKPKWQKLPQKEKEKIMEYLPRYKESQPDKKYRKDPDTFLNNKSWENEIIESNGAFTKAKSNTTGADFSSVFKDRGYD